MPFGFSHPALIVSWEPRSDERSGRGLSAEWSHSLKSQKTVPSAGYRIELLKFEGIDEALLLIPLGAQQTHPASQNLLATNSAWAMIAVESESELDEIVSEFDRWCSGLSPRQLARREVEQLDRWRVVPPVQFKGESERHLWRQSEVMLRMAQSREQNRTGRNSNGLIVASLPDGVWFTPWVRDMAWATVALAQMGHRDEARAALLAYFNAQPTGEMRAQTANSDYQISVVRYFGDGSEEPFFTEECSSNIEFDDWGEALWVLGQYLKKYDEPTLLRTPLIAVPSMKARETTSSNRCSRTSSPIKTDKLWQRTLPSGKSGRKTKSISRSQQHPRLWACEASSRSRNAPAMKPLALI